MWTLKRNEEIFLITQPYVACTGVAQSIFPICFFINISAHPSSCAVWVSWTCFWQFISYSLSLWETSWPIWWIRKQFIAQFVVILMSNLPHSLKHWYISEAFQHPYFFLTFKQKPEQQLSNLSNLRDVYLFTPPLKQQPLHKQKVWLEGKLKPGNILTQPYLMNPEGAS